MKAEINNENKAKFFGNYHGQNIGFWYRSKKDYRSGVTLIGENYGSISYIELKLLSDISDEDAVEAIMVSLGKSASEFEGSHREAVVYYITTTTFDSNEADFLRSRGYLVPWMGLSCEELIEAGWAKYKE